MVVPQVFEHRKVYYSQLYSNDCGHAGEFVIWADLATGMAALGFELVFVKSICMFWKLMKDGGDKKFDIIITDYDGIGTAENSGQFPRHHCKFFIVDGFGTQAPFNKRNIDLKRILTPYPFDNSNTPIHLITGVLPKSLWAKEREDYAILWAKLPKYLISRNDPERKIIGVVRNISNMIKLQSSIPANVFTFLRQYNIGDRLLPAASQRNRTEFLQLMTSAKFLLGIGMPVDGPTALEAIAHGCPFINPIFNPPRQQSGKPTRFNYTSQHPFIEANFGPPHVYTIDIFDHEVVEKTVRLILDSPPPEPFVHPSNSPIVYLENLRKIFYETECDTKSVPKRHPGNLVYPTFTAYVDGECIHKPCPESSHYPRQCAIDMYDRNLHNEYEQNGKVPVSLSAEEKEEMTRRYKERVVRAQKELDLESMREVEKYKQRKASRDRLKRDKGRLNIL